MNFSKRLDEVGEAFRAIGDELVIDQILFDDHMRHRAEDRHVRAGLERKPHLGKVHQLDAARIDDDHLRAVLPHRFLHLQRDDGMILARVRTRDDEHIVQHHLRGRVAHRRGTDRLLERNHRPRVTETRAMIHVVRAEQGAIHLLQKIIIFVRGFGAAIDRHRIRAIALVDFAPGYRRRVEGSIPVGLSSPNQRSRIRTGHS